MRVIAIKVRCKSGRSIRNYCRPWSRLVSRTFRRMSSGRVWSKPRNHPVPFNLRSPASIIFSPELFPNFFLTQHSTLPRNAPCKRCFTRKCLAEVFRFSLSAKIFTRSLPAFDSRGDQVGSRELREKSRNLWPERDGFDEKRCHQQPEKKHSTTRQRSFFCSFKEQRFPSRRCLFLGTAKTLFNARVRFRALS